MMVVFAWPCFPYFALNAACLMYHSSFKLLFGGILDGQIRKQNQRRSPESLDLAIRSSLTFDHNREILSTRPSR